MLSTFLSKDVDIHDKIIRLIAPWERFTIYYGLYNVDMRDADHVAQVTKSGSGYAYQISGHGIGHKSFQATDTEMLMRRILVDNQFFNLTDQIHIESS